MNFIINIFKALLLKIKKTVWFLGLNAFWLILFIVLFEIVLGGFIFYKYAFLAEKHRPQITGSIIEFNDKAYRDALNELQAR